MQQINICKKEKEQLLLYLPEINMSDRDKQIVQKYMTEKSTYKNIGEMYGISGERVRQILIKFNRKVRAVYSKKKREEEMS